MRWRRHRSLRKELVEIQVALLHLKKAQEFRALPRIEELASEQKRALIQYRLKVQDPQYSIIVMIITIIVTIIIVIVIVIDIVIVIVIVIIIIIIIYMDLQEGTPYLVVKRAGILLGPQ